MFKRSAGLGLVIAAWICSMAWADGQPIAEGEPAPPAQPDPPVEAKDPPRADEGVTIDNLTLRGTIEGANLSLQLTFDAQTEKPSREFAMIVGDVVLQKLSSPIAGHKLRYDAKTRSYFLGLPTKGKYSVAAEFAARAAQVGQTPWRSGQFDLPSAFVRKIELDCDRADLEVELPHAMRVERKVVGDRLKITAILGPGKPLTIRFKPQVQKLDAELVASANANVIALLEPGALSLDQLVIVNVSQGKLSELSFDIPADLSITQVQGAFIRDWSIEKKDGARTLRVVLNRPQDRSYYLRINGESPLGKFPAKISVPIIQPLDGLRTAGHLMVGTNSAIALVVDKTSGLSQIDHSAFPRITPDRNTARPMPRGKSFAYRFAGLPATLALTLDDVVPSYDASHRLVATVKEDDLILDAELEIDVRDAPVRSLSIDVPAGFNVANVQGALVEDYRVVEAEQADGRRVVVQFNKPWQGTSLITLRLEKGQSPLDQRIELTGPSIVGAKTQRGYLAVVVEQGLRISSHAPADEKILKAVHTGSIPMRVTQAELAYRFREANWQLALIATRRPAGIRVELFHLTSIGEGIAYGSVAANYFITGSPIDRLEFTIPDHLKNIEFVGGDVAGWSNEGDRWTVRLRRKVIGDYNLAVTYHQRYEDGQSIDIGPVSCSGVEVQSGYVIVASEMNLQLEAQGKPENLLAIEREEVPANYRLLVHGPILQSYKYVEVPHGVWLKLQSYERGELIPVVIEVVQVHSNLDVRSEGEAESITRVTYSVKNATSQYLSVLLPPDAQFRRVHRANMNPDGTLGAPVKVAVSHDDRTGAVLIPLQRNDNPNEPTTLILEYAQEHGTLGWKGHLALAAPSCDVPATYADWQVTVPDDWSVRPAGGMMTPTGASVVPLDLAWFGQQLVDAWGQAWQVQGTRLAVGVGLLIVMGLTLLVFFAARSVAPLLALAGALALVTIIGFAATQTAGFEEGLSNPPHGELAAFKQSVNVDVTRPLNVAVAIVPTWREHVTTTASIAAPIVAMVLLIGAGRWRRIRPLCLAGAAVALLVVLTQFPEAIKPLGYLMTWGLPVLLGLGVLIALGRRIGNLRAARRVAAAVLLLGLLLVPAGCFPERIVIQPITDQPVVRDIKVGLAAELDSMVVNMSLSLSSTKPARYRLLESTAVLISDSKPTEFVTIEREDDYYYVDVDKAGTYDLKIEFLSPLARTEPGQPRRFSMPMPLSLANEVTLVVDDDQVEIEPVDAVSVSHKREAKQSLSTAVFAPGQPAVFGWRPRARSRENEQTVFYSQVTSAFRFDAGTIEGRHLLALQVAQGELKQIQVMVPKNMTVTAVNGADLGAWRFDPATGELVAVLSEPAVGSYNLLLVTQTSIDKLPAQLEIGSLVIKDAARQRGTMGLLTGDAVYVDVTANPQKMNVDDFQMSAVQLFGAQRESALAVRHAFRLRQLEDKATVTVHSVRPELRVKEQATFSVADDRLVYNGTLSVTIAKAGQFSADLRLPAAFDIDALQAKQVSHWDESVVDGVRHVQVHFRQKLLGQVDLRLAMSQPVSELPRKIVVPRIEVHEAIKHTGRIVVAADRGVRLNVTEREGVSELPNITDRAQRTTALAYRLLRPDWVLVLETEVIEPLVNVEFIHVADVNEGLVRHTHILRYELHNAGLKVFEVQVPDDVLGLQIEGQNIARRQRVGPGRHRIELTNKWFDRPYFLKLTYETQFSRELGKVMIAPVDAIDADHQRGFVVVNKTDRVQLSVEKVGGSLTPTDARAIRGFVGAPDLSAAAFAWRSTASAFELDLNARRLDALAQMEANVISSQLVTVVTERGDTLNHIQMQLRVGAKRYLRTQLPAGSQVWSLTVNGKAVAPSKGKLPGGHDVLLIPLAQASMGEMPVSVEMIYVRNLGLDKWAGRRVFEGPKFDLPLKDMRWAMYVPEAFDYDDFEGTLTINEEILDEVQIMDYDAMRYAANVIKVQDDDNARARELQRLGNDLATQGKQYQARQALELGWNYSKSDPALNEDIRVDLHNLRRQQAVVGLYGSRARLRKVGEQVQGPNAAAPMQVDDQFDVQTAQRIEATLDQAEAGNLFLITTRIIELQESTAAQASQLTIDMPRRGRLLEFRRPIQVNPFAEMSVEFDVERQPAKRATAMGSWAGGLFVTFALAFGIVSLVSRYRPQAAEPVEHGQVGQQLAEPSSGTEHDITGADSAGDEPQDPTV